MASSVRISASIRATIAITLLCLLAAITNQPARAQTYTVLHNFNGFPDGGNPVAGLTMDGAGNLYGTASYGGDPYCDNGSGCGTVFRLKHEAGGWVLDVLQTFTEANGFGPEGRVVFGPDGALYGTTAGGGSAESGVIFRLSPPPNICRAVSCTWTETLLYQFQDGSDGASPESEVLFDGAGNFYGTAPFGGTFGARTCGPGCGVVYKMTHSGSGWTYGVIYSFTGTPDGDRPFAGLTFDHAGNLYGTTWFGGGQNQGMVYELTPSGGGSWQETVLHSFAGGDGENPEAGLIVDHAGNLYGSGNTDIFELSPANGGWDFSTLYTFEYYLASEATLTMDSAGNLYGTAKNYGNNGSCGEVFELSPQGGRWIYTTLHSFQGSDGCQPVSTVLMDANGNLFGTTSQGGTRNEGVVWEITHQRVTPMF
jgi:uncharacterized repeat protein (TIGR03803 family)